MEEKNNSLQKFEDIILCRNKISPESSTNFNSNVSKPFINIDSSTLSVENDSAFSETFFLSEHNAECVEVSEHCCPMPYNKHHVAHFSKGECAMNQKADSGQLESENIANVNEKLIIFDGMDQGFLEASGFMNIDFEYEENDFHFKDNEFYDAVDFLNDSCYEDHFSMEKYPTNWKVNSDIRKSETIADDSAKLIVLDGIKESFITTSGVMNADFKENDNQLKDNKFCNDVDFNNSFSLNILENVGLSKNWPSKSLSHRNSIYQKFDPLYENFPSRSDIKIEEFQESKDNRIEPDDGKLINTSEIKNLKGEVQTDNVRYKNETALLETSLTDLQSNAFQGSSVSDLIPSIMNKRLFDASLRQSLGNMLSFETQPEKNSDFHYEDGNSCNFPKIYSDKELKEALKIQELSLQGTFLKRQRELEMKLQEQKTLSNSLYATLKEVMHIVNFLSSKRKLLSEKNG